jgi:glycosyltransferase involved in cell wall biosynthesis
MTEAVRGSEWWGMEFAHPWDPIIRPVPSNWHRIREIEDAGAVDVILAQSIDGAHVMQAVDAPMLFNQPNDCSEGEIPAWLEERCYAFNFISPEVSDRWTVRDQSKKRVIAMPIDPKQFKPYIGDGMGHDILTVGHHIVSRWDKGNDAIRTFDQVMLRCDLLGPGNFGLRCALGPRALGELYEAYRHYKVYFNPGPIIGIAVAEAMLTGIPVVSFQPINQRALLVDGVTALVTDTLDGAYIKIKRLLTDPQLRMKIGTAGRDAARKVFDPVARGGEWAQLFREAVASYKSRRLTV